MKLYLAPTSVVQATPPNGGYHATTCPDDPTLSLVLVLDWRDHLGLDAWEARPGVVAWEPENMGSIAPTGAIRAAASWGLAPNHTGRQAIKIMRRHWPALKPLW